MSSYRHYTKEISYRRLHRTGILLTLLIATSFTLSNAQKELRLIHNFMGYTLHQLSIKNYEKGHDAFDLKELVVGNEKGYCEAVEGFWNEETRECLNVHEKYCRLLCFLT